MFPDVAHGQLIGQPIDDLEEIRQAEIGTKHLFDCLPGCATKSFKAAQNEPSMCDLLCDAGHGM
jgi:hypothetical protein